MKNKVSVIMSCYNETKDELKKAIESILSQSYFDFEFIIILDNPNNSELKKTVNSYDDERIILICNTDNIGLAASLNKGINCAKGEYIARMDADDISLPNRLSVQVDYLDKNSDIDIVSSFVIQIDENDNIIREKSILPREDESIKKLLSLESVIVHPAAMFRKEKIEAIGSYRLFPTSQDYDLWIRCMNAGYKFYNIPIPLLKYRIRSNSISKSNPRKQYLIRRYIRKINKKNKKSIPFSLDNLNSYLIHTKALDEVLSSNFKKSIYYYEQFKFYLRKRRFFSSICNLFKALFVSKTFILFFCDSLKKQFLKYELRKKLS